MKKQKQLPTSVVTGAAGFLGSHLTDLLLSRGHRVIGIDNFVTGSVDNIAHLGGNPNFKFIEQDVTEFIFLDSPVNYVWIQEENHRDYELQHSGETGRKVKRFPD